MFLVMWNHWHWHLHYVVPMALSMAPLHALGQMIKIKYIFLVIWHCCNWCHHNMMSTTLSMAPLQLLGQDDWNKVQHDFFDHVIPLTPVLASWCQWYCQWYHCIHYSNMTEMRCAMIFFIWHHSYWCQHNMMPTTLSKAPLHLLHQEDQNKVQHDFLAMWYHWCKHQHHVVWWCCKW